VTRARRETVAAAALFAALTIVWTWPLAAGVGRDIPADLGDPLLNAWILAWDATHLGRGWWNANIFAPHTVALAYSEHLLAQSLQIAPVYALTKNPILCYNLLFLSTFVLSGLGMFLLARELTGNRADAIVAGVAYAFAPYRVAALPHLQVLSSAWMPFALFGFRRYFETRRTRALAGATAAWTLQNLSCGYYLLFFSPIVVMYLAWEIVSRRRTITTRTIAAIATACAAALSVAAPFALPYLHVRRLGFGPRPLADVERFSADVYAYLTADPNVHVWGSIARAWEKPEGALFPGLMVTALALVAIARQAVQARQPGSPERAAPHPIAPYPITVALRALWLACAAMLVAVLLGWTVRLPLIKITSLSRLIAVMTAVALALLATSRDARTKLAAWVASPVGFFTIVLIFAVAMSFGPDVHSRGRQIAASNIYTLFYDHVPGFDGLRVPARFGMIAALALATLAAHAIRRERTAAIAALVIFVESLAAPIPINRNDTNYRQHRLVPLPARVSTSDAPDLYAFVAQLPDTASLVELPLGEPAFDVRYMFYSTRHWKRLVNGYSGGAPADYGLLTEDLQDALSRPDRAWETLRRTRATHAIVHEAFYDGERGRAISTWLRSRGARDVAAFGSDRVLLLN
jgi:hypothetical protein